jgi:AcrR family transcriptional regulator
MILDKKTAIFDATLDLISVNGFHATPMSMVAKQAKVAAGTIYHYFPSKDELIAELFIQQKNVLQQIIDDAETVMKDKPFKDRFKQVYRDTFEYMVKNKKVFLFLEQYMCSPFAQKSKKDQFEEFFKPLSEFLKKGLFNKELKEMNSKLAVSMFYGNISALVKLALGGTVNMDHMFMHDAFNICWDGLKKG